MTIEIPQGLRIIEIGAVCSIAEYERCVLVVWRLQPTRAAFDRRHQILAELAARYPRKCAYVEVIESTSTPPTNELRKVAVEVFRKLGKDLACVGFVLDGTELRTTMVRAILTTMTFFVPQMQPSKVFKRLSDVPEFVRSHIGDAGFDPRTFVTAFDYLRRTIVMPAASESESRPST
jgi:hypothetical protein